MPNSETVFASILVVILAGAALGFGWAQCRTLLRASHLPDIERGFESRRAYRRLVGCGLLLLMALLLVVQVGLWEWYVKLLEPPIAPEDKMYVRLWAGAWVGILVCLIVVLVLAAYDSFATRAYLLREYGRLAAERRAMVQRQADRLREES
jgi:hypothetical protein